MSRKLNQPKLSVVIPAFNEEDCLADCLRAVLAQTVKPYEIIVVDNASTDNTAAIAKSFAGVKVITQDTPGITAARDIGFNAATGEIIVRTDADSLPVANWLERVSQSLTSDVQAVTGPIYYPDLPAQKLLKHLGIYIQGKLAGPGSRPKFLAGANMAIRSSTWRALSPKLCRRNNIHEDLDLAIHLIKNGNVIGYDKEMRVATSPRRLRGDSRDFYKYIRAYEHTYSLHGIKNLSIKVPMLCFLPLHFMAKLLSRTNKKSVHSPFIGSEKA